MCDPRLKLMDDLIKDLTSYRKNRRGVTIQTITYIQKWCDEQRKVVEAEFPKPEDFDTASNQELIKMADDYSSKVMKYGLLKGKINDTLSERYKTPAVQEPIEKESPNDLYKIEFYCHSKVKGTMSYLIPWDSMQEGDILILEREPTNPHDPNAIKILFGDVLLGYIPRGTASSLAPIIDTGKAGFFAHIESITGGTEGKEFHGMNIKIFTKVKL